MKLARPGFVWHSPQASASSTTGHGPHVCLPHGGVQASHTGISGSYTPPSVAALVGS